MQKNLIIRVSRINKSLILSCNQEKVYRVFINGKEEFNNLNYDSASNFFNTLEENIYK